MTMILPFVGATGAGWHKRKQEDHWSCIAHLSAEDMLNLNKLGLTRAFNAV